MADEKDQITLEKTQKFLSCHLGRKEIAIISLAYIIEVLQVSLTEICSVPQMVNCVLGIYNWRGEMLWLVDLGNILGYAPLSQATNLQSKVMLIVVQYEEKYLGLIVRDLIDIDGLDISKMQSSSNEFFSSEIASLLQGYFMHDSEGITLNLDIPAIIKSPMWSIHN